MIVHDLFIIQYGFFPQKDRAVSETNCSSASSDSTCEVPSSLSQGSLDGNNQIGNIETITDKSGIIIIKKAISVPFNATDVILFGAQLSLTRLTSHSVLP